MGNVAALFASMVAAGLLVRRGRHPEHDGPAPDGEASPQAGGASSPVDEFEVWRHPPQNIPAAYARRPGVAPRGSRPAPVTEPPAPPFERPSPAAPATVVETRLTPSAPPQAPPRASAAAAPSGRGAWRIAVAACLFTALALVLTFAVVPALVDDERPSEPASAAAAPPAAAPAPAPAAPAQGDLVPRDVAATAGLEWSGPTSGESCVFDYDGNGVDDVFLTTGGGLYAGRADGRFVRTNATTFPARDRQGCATADFNGDGRLDLYASVGRCAAPCTSADELWIQKPDGTFIDRAAELGLETPGGRGRLPITLDANADDRPDLFTAQAGTATAANRNRLWVNKAGRGFANPPGLPSASIGIGCGTSGDVDEDGDDEMFVCGGQDGEYFLRAYENRGGRWSQANGRLGLPDHGRADAELGHMDGDGLLDLVLISPTALEIRLNRDGRFPRRDYSLPLDAGRDVAIADADGDGLRDIYVVQAQNREVPDLLLLNRGDTRFASVRGLPDAVGGEGDTVQALPDYGGTRRAGFLVGNGRGGQDGPRQLVQLTPAG